MSRRPVLAQKTRKSPLTASDIKALRASVIALVTQEPRSLRFLALRHGFRSRTIVKYINEMRDLGLIHSTKPAGTPMKTPHLWTIGPGMHVVLPPLPKPGKGEAEQQSRVTTWPALTIPKQGPFSALFLTK